MIRVLREMLLLQWRSFSREPGVLFWALAFPVILTGLLGMAFSRKKAGALPVLLIAADAREAADLEALLRARPPGELLKAVVKPEAQALLDLKRGQAVLALRHGADPARLSFLMDGGNPEAETAQHRARAWLEGRPPARTEALALPGTRYVDFIVPGMFASSIINSCLWGVGWVLIEYRQKKFMRRFVATPLRRRDFFLSLYLGRVMLNALEFAILFGFTSWLFGVRIQGGAAAFLAAYFAGSFAFFGLACLIASRTANPQVGIGLINAVTMPMFIVSGMFFSYERFPAFLHPLLRAFPPTMLVDALRGVMNEGAGLRAVLPACLSLGAMGALCLLAARRIFRWY